MENHNKFLEKILNDINSNYSEIKDIFKIHNGINSNVYKISFFKKTDSVLKIYSNSKKVNSLINEKKFLELLLKNKITNCPKIYYSNEELNFSLLSFINGKKILNPKKIHMDAVVKFMMDLNKIALSENSNLVGKASESFFNLKDIYTNVKNKLFEKYTSFSNPNNIKN